MVSVYGFSMLTYQKEIKYQEQKFNKLVLNSNPAEFSTTQQYHLIPPPSTSKPIVSFKIKHFLISYKSTTNRSKYFKLKIINKICFIYNFYSLNLNLFIYCKSFLQAFYLFNKHSI